MQNFTEDEIRPPEFNKEEFVIKDLERLLSKKRGFVHINCPACNGNDFVEKFTKDDIDYFECKNCKTVFINPRPTVDILRWFYKDSELYNFYSNYIFPSSEKTRREKIIIPRVDRVIGFCNEYDVPNGVLMEIGPGYGTFCEEIRSRNFFKKIIIVEPTHSLAEDCKKRGFEVIESTIEDVNIESGVNAIVSFEVIEHLFSPKNFLLKCCETLCDDGLLILTCPNFDGFDLKILGKASDNVYHEHLNYFNPNSISLLLEKTGFDTLEILTPGVLDAEIVRKKIISNKYFVDGQPFIEDVLINKWESVGDAFQSFLAQNKMSSNLWVVARKKSKITEASNYNKEFEIYKNIHKGKSGILLATGQTIKDYSPIVEDGAIKVGVNSIYEHKELLNTLDYYFFGSNYEANSHRKECVDNIDKKTKKFASTYRNGGVTRFGNIIPEHAREIDAMPFDCGMNSFVSDISNNRILGHSIVFPALQFLLYTGVDKIYVVGCDVKDFYGEDNTKQLKELWDKFKIWVVKAYPYVDIIIVNPVGLKGMFINLFQNENSL